MTFKSYFDHSEPIFKDLNILNIFEINDYLTALFMFRYHHLNQNFLKIILWQTTKFINITREMHQNFTSVIKEQIM
jgi:hypothetical protein